MSTILIALAGIVLVLLLILLFRLPPLIGLLIGSLFLLAATPEELVHKSYLDQYQLEIAGMTSNGLIGLKQNSADGEYVFLGNKTIAAESNSLTLTRASSKQLSVAENRGELSPSNLVWYGAEAKELSISAGAIIVSKSKYEELGGQRWTGLGDRLVSGFAGTFQKIGIPVTMAAIVGICLLQSGAASRLVMAIVALFGKRGTTPALTASGFVLGIPVFFDNVFYLLLPLAKSVGRASPEKMLTAVMAIVVGATMAHSLVPPTPGPLLVVQQVNAEIRDPDFQIGLGMMMFAGLVVGGSAACAGFAYGCLCPRWVQLDSSQLDEKSNSVEPSKKLPLWVAALPVAIPIMLLGGSEAVEVMARDKPATSRYLALHEWTQLVNDPTLVFIGAALAAIAILHRYGGRDSVGKAVAKGLSDAGTIILLTCAGGAFGKSLKGLDLANAIGDQFQDLSSPWTMLYAAFLLTALVRFAQGSATVSMITSSAIIAPLIDTSSMPFHPLYIALAIGCGSKPLPWMNDSGFWQVTTMTGLKPTQTLQTFSVALTLMGIVGFGVTLLGAKFFPLVEALPTP
ncbi:MAG: SLC13 family permease [Planctomycetota bacterium]|nr:SLC13 family permease [Planctomycetota bacterium]